MNPWKILLLFCMCMLDILAAKTLNMCSESVKIYSSMNCYLATATKKIFHDISLKQIVSNYQKKKIFFHTQMNVQSFFFFIYIHIIYEASLPKNHTGCQLVSSCVYSRKKLHTFSFIYFFYLNQHEWMWIKEKDVWGRIKKRD